MYNFFCFPDESHQKPQRKDLKHRRPLLPQVYKISLLFSKITALKLTMYRFESSRIDSQKNRQKN